MDSIHSLGEGKGVWSGEELRGNVQIGATLPLQSHRPPRMSLRRAVSGQRGTWSLFLPTASTEENPSVPRATLGSVTRNLGFAGFSDKRVWGANGHLAGLVWK